MTIPGNKDFLEVLRHLNKDNINNDSELRDRFFDSLMVLDTNCPEYLENLSDSYSQHIERDWQDSPVKGFVLSQNYSNEIYNQLTDHLVEDRIDSLYVDRHNAPYLVTYVGAMKGVKKLVSEEPNHFAFFKQQLLLGLITRYANDYQGIAYPERLSQLVGIYAEHKEGLEPIGEIPRIIDEEYLTAIQPRSLSSNKILHETANLIDRTYPKTYDQYFDFNQESRYASNEYEQAKAHK